MAYIPLAVHAVAARSALQLGIIKLTLPGCTVKHICCQIALSIILACTNTVGTIKLNQ